MQLNPYLFFNGQCEAAFKFYEQTLGGKIEAMIPHAGTPAEGQITPEWRDKIMHARMAVGNTLLMASDAPPDHSDGAMRGFRVNLAIEDPQEAERIFQELSEGGTVQMPIQQTFWALRFGMLVDRFGTPWMINCEEKK
jgi:PhnB protein